jgi:hypothetical protein
MSEQKTKTVRNPSKEEMEKLSQSQQGILQVQGVPVSSVTDEEIDSDITKTIDEFEPAPVKFRLPSGSTTVKKKYLTDNNEILVRRFTSIEESMFKKFSEAEFMLAIEPQMDSCIKTNISVQDLSFIDKIPLYLFLIALTYGKDFEIDYECEVCLKEFKMKIDLQKEVIDAFKYVPDGFEYPKIVKLDSLGGDINAFMHFQTVGESNLISDKGTILDQMLILIKKTTGTAASGKTITPEQRESIVKFMDDKDRKKFRNWIEEFSKYGTSLVLNKSTCKNGACEMCDKKVEILLPLAQLMMTLIKRII